MAKPYLPNLEPIIAAGLDPKTGLPIKMGGCSDENLKPGIKMSLRVLDEQDAVNRYKWYNLPCGITSQELERMLYYKGQLAFFYMEDVDEFYFMPYALDGGIDFYGRYRGIHPVPFTEGSDNPEEEKRIAKQREMLSQLKLKCVYDVLIDIPDMEQFTKSAVLLHDYTKQMSQSIIPRQAIQEPILDVMADCIPFMKTAMLNSTGVMGMRVGNTDEYSNVDAASDAINRAARNSKKYVPVIGMTEFQDLTGGETGKAEEFLMAMQSLDNYRLSLHGLNQGGIFQKKSHMLEAEQQMNAGTTGLVYQDGLSIRQHFCDVVNSIWGLGISCEPSEVTMQADINGDGLAYDDQDQSGAQSGEQPDMGGTDNDM